MSAPQVLVAEDEAEIRALVAEVLEGQNLRVIQAVDGQEAMELLKANPTIALLLSDVKMPRKNGYDLVEEALELNPELKVLMMTAYVHEHPPPSVLHAREIRTLTKPFNLNRMCDVVADMLSRS